MYGPEKSVHAQENWNQAVENMVYGQENFCNAPENCIHSPEKSVHALEKTKNQNRHCKIELFISKNHKNEKYF